MASNLPEFRSRYSDRIPISTARMKVDGSGRRILDSAVYVPKACARAVKG